MPGTITIPAQATTITVDLLPIQDTLAEGQEAAILTLVPDSPENPTYTIGMNSFATVGIQDRPWVQVIASKPLAAEAGPKHGEFTFSRSVAEDDQALTIFYQVDSLSTATNGEDFQTLSGTITIPAGEFSVKLPVQVVPDGLVEGTEYVVLTISEHANYIIAEDSGSDVVWIEDGPMVSIEATIPSASEVGPVDGQFTVTRMGGRSDTYLTVKLALSDYQEAVEGLDYQTFYKTITFAPGVTSRTIKVDVIQDRLEEGPEAMGLKIVPDDTYAIDPAGGGGWHLHRRHAPGMGERTGPGGQ